MSLTLGYVTLDCADAAALAALWAAALGWKVTYQADDGAVLEGGVEGAPSLFLQVVPEPKAGKNRVHLDFGADAFDADLDRLVGLGATILNTSNTPSGSRSAVMADPEGNEFCLAMNDAAAEVIIREPIGDDWAGIGRLADAAVAHIPGAPRQAEWVTNRQIFRGRRRHHVAL